MEDRERDVGRARHHVSRRAVETRSSIQQEAVCQAGRVVLSTRDAIYPGDDVL